MLIREATDHDIGAITALQNALIETTTYEWIETPHNVDERLEWLHRQRAAGRPVLVAVADESVVGWCSYGDFRDATRWPGYRFTVEHTIHVAESQWGRGVGRALMAELEDHARRQGKRVMVAGIDGSNVGSIDFHRRLGYVEVARMPGVGDKWGQRLDLVLLQREL